MYEEQKKKKERKKEREERESVSIEEPLRESCRKKRLSEDQGL
jgi:hypothetical protein